MGELENLVCQTQEQLEVAQKIMADEKDRRSLSYQKIVDQTGIPKSTAERFLGLKSSNSSTVYFIVLCKLFGMSADSFFDISKESPTGPETDQAAHKIELLQLKNKYLEEKRNTERPETLENICAASGDVDAYIAEKAKTDARYSAVQKEFQRIDASKTALEERRRKLREENPWIYEEAEKFRQEAIRIREEAKKQRQ